MTKVFCKMWNIHYQMVTIRIFWQSSESSRMSTKPGIGNKLLFIQVSWKTMELSFLMILSYFSYNITSFLVSEIIIKKRTCQQVKIKENEKRDKYLDLAREVKKKLWNMKVKVIPTIIGLLGMIPKDFIKGLEAIVRLAIILKRVLQKIDVTQTPVRNHQLTLAWKTLKRVR